jgi:PAS domain S-box-containing protein
MVTQIERIQDEARLDEEDFQLLFESAPIGMGILSLDTRFLRVNKAFCDIVGYTESELLGRSVMDITHPDDVDTNMALDQQLLDSGSASFEMRKRYVHKSGRTVPVILKVTLGRRTNGQPSYFIGQVIDLTEIKQAELDQETHGQVLDNMIEGVNVADENGVITFTNRAFDTMFGYKPGELKGQHVSVLNALSAEENQRLVENIIDIMRDEGIWIGEFHNRKKNGEIFTTSARITTLKIDGRKLWISVQEDITQKKKTEVEISRRLQAEETLASISAHLVQVTDFDQAVEGALEQIGKFLPAERAALMRFQSGEYTIQQNYEWHTKDAPPLPYNAPNFPTWILSKLQAGESIVIEDVAQLPSEEIEPRAILERRELQSLAMFPLYAEGNLIGAFGCSNFQSPQSGMEQHLVTLEAVAGLFASLLHRELVLESLEQRVAERTKELFALMNITMLAGETRELESLLEPALDQIREIGRCDAVCIHLLSEDKESLELVAQRGLAPDTLTDLVRKQPIHTFEKWFESPDELIMQSVDKEDSHWPKGLILEGYQAYLGSLIRAREDAIGILSCYRTSGEVFSEERISLLSALCEQLGIIIENQRLRRNAEELAALEERQRLARNLHDALTQSLYSLTLFARAGHDAWEERDDNRLRENLDQLEDNALRVLKEMRLLLYQLQPSGFEEGGFNRALELRFDLVERRLGINVSFHAAAIPPLPHSIEEELYHIAMEALNNSLKHSGTQQVIVSLKSSREELILDITDYGAGFDMDQVNGGLGLQNMQERAHLIDATLSITSRSEAGTRVRVNLPLKGNDRMNDQSSQGSFRYEANEKKRS